MAKDGFNGQWVEIFKAGRQTDSESRAHNIDRNYLQQVVNNYDEAIHESPAVLGHPEKDLPAVGWVKELRVNGESLEAKFGETDDNFEQIVREGKYKKRSASFYIDAKTAPGGKAPYLRHVGFLGAQPPSVKGLRDIQFGEGESLTFEIQFNEGEMMEEKDMDMDKVADSIFERLKSKFGFGTSNPKTEETPSANFSEAQITAMVTKAVEDANQTTTASFTEKLTQLENENKSLRESVTNLSGSSKRAEIIAFAERLGTAKFPPAFKRMGVVEFMESLAANDTKVSVISFSEENGKTVEKKEEKSQLEWFQNFLESMPNFIAFGEHFANITSTPDADNIVDPNRLKTMRAEMGIKNGGEK